MTTIIWFIIIFGTIVIVHEFGHYYFAKQSGILVREFSIGMGPKLFSTRRHGTAYTLRALPLGGYVRMAGWQDDDSSIQPGAQVSLITNAAGEVTRINTTDKLMLAGGIPLQVSTSDLVKQLTITGYVNGDESAEQTFQVHHDATVIEADGIEVQIAPEDVQFQSVSIWRRMLVNFAGPMNNFILAIVAFFALALAMGTPSTTNIIGGINTSSPAATAGMQAGDRIVKVGGVTTPTFADLQTQIGKHKNEPVSLTIKRAGAVKTLRVTPKDGMIGITSSIDHGVVNAVQYGFAQPWHITTQIFAALKSMVTGGFSLNKLAGPVGIYKMTGEAAQGGLYNVIWFLASLSVNLGIMNLLPIPMLDGGKLILNLLELIRRKPLPAEKEGMVTVIGAGLVFALMIAVTINDILRIF